MNYSMNTDDGRKEIATAVMHMIFDNPVYGAELRELSKNGLTVVDDDSKKYSTQYTQYNHEQHIKRVILDNGAIIQVRAIKTDRYQSVIIFYNTLPSAGEYSRNAAFMHGDGRQRTINLNKFTDKDISETVLRRMVNKAVENLINTVKLEKRNGSDCFTGLSTIKQERIATQVKYAKDQRLHGGQVMHYYRELLLRLSPDDGERERLDSIVHQILGIKFEDFKNDSII